MSGVSTRLAIGIVAAIGLSALARTAAYYERQDSLSLALVATMTVVFVTGIVELFQRAARAERLTREIATLPVPASEATIDGASPPVRALLRARLAQMPSSAPAAPLASYLVGLLVMLGLLGTFLGLLETIRGAREALATSGDIEALRAGLSLPMQGLTRSFGTSAAGVSTSALLGLAATFAHRREARLAQTSSAYASEALAPLTLGRRQLAALERIALQGDALPAASLALREAVTNLATIETSWTRAHAEAAQRSAEALTAAVESVRADLAGAIERSAQAASRVLTPLVERTVEGAVAAATRHVAEVRGELEGDRASRLAAEAAHAARAEEAERARIARDEARDAALAATTDRIARSASATIDGAARTMSVAGDRDEARGAALDRLVAAIDAQREALAAASERHVATVEAMLRAIEARAETNDARARAEREAFVTRADEARAAADARTVALEAEIARAHAGYAAELVERIGVHAEATQAGAARSAEVVREAAALVQSGGAELVAVAEMFAGAVDRHREAAAAWLESLGGVEAAVDQASESLAARGLGEQLDRARELFDVQLQFHRELLLQLRAGARPSDGGAPRLHDADAAPEESVGDAPG